MKTEKASALERLLAIIIDLFIISAISLMLTSWMPVSDTYKAAQKRLDQINEKRKSKEINDNDWQKQYEEENYIINRESIIQTSVNMTIMFGYYVVFVYYYKGQTIGKKILKIRVVDEEGNNPTFLTLLLRAGIINNLFFSIISSVMIFIVSKEIYFKYFSQFSMVMVLVLLFSLFMIIIRKDRRGIHDLLLKTDVVKE